VLHSAIHVGEAAVNPIFFIENVGNQGIGLNRRVRVAFDLDLHVVLSRQRRR
jgi:hypothetical protein